MTFHVFHQTWWKRDTSYPGGRRPGAGRKTTIGYASTEEEAQSMCKAWNAEHEPGFLSRKAEYERD